MLLLRLRLRQAAPSRRDSTGLPLVVVGPPVLRGRRASAAARREDLPRNQPKSRTSSMQVEGRDLSPASMGASRTVMGRKPFARRRSTNSSRTSRPRWTRLAFRGPRRGRGSGRRARRRAPLPGEILVRQRGVAQIGIETRELRALAFASRTSGIARPARNSDRAFPDLPRRSTRALPDARTTVSRAIFTVEVQEPRALACPLISTAARRGSTPCKLPVGVSVKTRSRG